jgi:MFS family permease
MTVGTVPSLARPWPAGLTRVLVARLLLGSYFFVPYIALYAMSLRIPLGTLLVIEALFALLTVLFDLPAGHLADRMGARQVLVLGALLEGIAALLLGGLPHAAVFWAVQPLFAASQSLTMGADVALASGVLRVAGRLAEFEAEEQLYQSLRLATMAVVLVSSSALSLVALRVPFLATGLAQLGAVMVLLTVPDVRSQSDIGPERLPLWDRLRGLVTSARRSAGLPIDLVAMILTGTAFFVLLYLMPVYFVGSGINEHLIGVCAAGVALAAAAASHLLPGQWTLRVTVTLAVLASAALGTEFIPVIVVAAVIIQSAQARLLPRYQARIMADLQGHGEATAMSIVTTSRNIGFVVLAPFIGLLTARLGSTGLSLACAALFLLAGLVMSARLSRHQMSQPSTQQVT